jgi:hypothetical protein
MTVAARLMARGRNFRQLQTKGRDRMDGPGYADHSAASA